MNKGLWGVIVVAILVAVVVGAQASKNRSPGTVSVTAESMHAAGPMMSLPSQVVVYYFHGNARCSSCYKIEQYAREGVEQNFPNEMKSGRIIFKRINVEQSGNDHYVQDYQLYTKSVVISLVKEGKQVKYRNLERVWDLIRDQNQFHEYVRDEVKPLLGEL